jgi:hypothetical protein
MVILANDGGSVPLRVLTVADLAGEIIKYLLEFEHCQ